MKSLIVWGGFSQGLESHRHIHGAFHENALKLGIDSRWVSDHEGHDVPAGSTVISADIYGHHLPYFPDVRYVLHNFDASHPVIQQARPGQILRLQVWTTDATGEEWGTFRQFDRAGGILFQPWGTDLLAEEFMEPVFNPESRDVTFVGAIWGDRTAGVELGNESVMHELRAACIARQLKFRHLTQVDDDFMRQALRAARVTPALAGLWQVEHGYIPCRVFKLPSYGTLAFTNVLQASALLGMGKPGTVEELLDRVLGLREATYLELVRWQQEVVARYTYRESLAAIDRAFEELA